MLRVKLEPEQAQWLSRYWLEVQVRRAEGAVAISIVEGGAGGEGGEGERDDDAAVVVFAHAGAGAACDEPAFCAHWAKQLGTALKKVDVEDLGAMDAAELLFNVREDEKGFADLTAAEEAEKVLVFFEGAEGFYGGSGGGGGGDDALVGGAAGGGGGRRGAGGKRKGGHVKLVGQKKKLERKCGDLRNMLSHYHWRMSGQDVAWDDMVAPGGKKR